MEAIAIWLAAHVFDCTTEGEIADTYFAGDAEVSDESHAFDHIDAADLMDAIGEVLDLDAFADEEDAARLAVARHLDCPLSSVETGIGSGPYGYGITIWAEGGEYAVLNGNEADDAWDEALESCLDECVEGADAPYFDRDAWKRDAKYDGRGPCLNGYDGSEECEAVNGEWLYIYRTN